MMKPIFIFMTVMALAIAQQVNAQTGRYYLGERQVTREQFLSVPASAIESMNKSVEDGESVIRINLKAGINADSIAAIKPDTAAVKAAKSAEAAGARSAAEAISKAYDQTTRLKKGDEAADFTAPKYAGGKASLSEYKGKVVLLCFWATWCGPCLRELSPNMLPKMILERFADNKDFVFLPIAYTDTAKTLDDFFFKDSNNKKQHAYLSEITLMDPDKKIFEKYAERAVPRSFVIGRDGKIVHGSLGASNDEIQSTAEAIAEALK